MGGICIECWILWLELAVSPSHVGSFGRDRQAQLGLARAEREEALTLCKRERAEAARRISALETEKEQLQREKEALSRSCEQRCAAFRRETEQAKVDGVQLKKLLEQVGALRQLSATVLADGQVY